MSDDSGDESDENTNFIGTYEGERNELCERHGDGKAVLPNKDIYTGQYSEGLRQGLGTYQVMKKDKVLSTYDGEWSQGMRSGFGTCKYDDGSEYKGNWENDARNGRGTMKFANGQEYQGLWKAGLREDLDGLMKFPGGLHIGGWKAGIMQGPGVIIYEPPAPAVCLISSWENGKPQGPGVVVRENYYLKGNFLPNGIWRISGHHPIALLEQHLRDSPFEQIFNILSQAAEMDETSFTLKYEKFLEKEAQDQWKCNGIKEIANCYMAAKTWRTNARRSSSLKASNTDIENRSSI